VLYMAVGSEDIPAGQVRFQIDDTKAAVSISMAPHFRGKGLGAAVLGMATKDLFQTTAVTQIDAYVKLDNAASLQLFTRADYVRVRNEIIKGYEAVHFVLVKTADVCRDEKEMDLSFCSVGETA
jgi:RimJ/RimL family protein N-acetyltransferase